MCPTLDAADVPLDRDVYLRSILSELTGLLVEVVGVEDATGFVDVVGRKIAGDADEAYRQAVGGERLEREQVPDVLVDLMRRLGGDFCVLEQDDEKIVLKNRVCPFGEQVHGRPALCALTSSMLGSITACNLGYARVDLRETIAHGADGCRLVIWLRPGRENEDVRPTTYFGQQGPM